MNIPTEICTSPSSDRNLDPVIALDVYRFEIDVTYLVIVYFILSYEVASGSEITPCTKIDKPLEVYRFSGNVMTSITTLRTL